MKSLRILFVTAMLLCTFGLGTAFAQQIVVANGTGFTIMALGLVDSNSGGNAQDFLGNDVLSVGEGLRINISGSPRGGELIAEDDKGNQINWQNLDLSGISKIVLRRDGTADLG